MMSKEKKDMYIRSLEHFLTKEPHFFQNSDLNSWDGLIQKTAEEFCISSEDADEALKEFLKKAVFRMDPPFKGESKMNIVFTGMRPKRKRKGAV